MPRIRPFLAVSVLAMIAMASGYVFLVRPFNLRGRQVADMVRCREFVRLLDAYHDTHKKYPWKLLDAVPAEDLGRFGALDDAWGHPLDYRSDGTMYLLISLGRDGRPDGLDFSALRAHKTWEKVCGRWDADQVFSDLGEHRICGK